MPLKQVVWYPSIGSLGCATSSEAMETKIFMVITQLLQLYFKQISQAAVANAHRDSPFFDLHISLKRNLSSVDDVAVLRM